jgi:hypothetical protein
MVGVRRASAVRGAAQRTAGGRALATLPHPKEPEPTMSVFDLLLYASLAVYPAAILLE